MDRIFVRALVTVFQMAPATEWKEEFSMVLGMPPCKGGSLQQVRCRNQRWFLLWLLRKLLTDQMLEFVKAV